MESIQAGFVAMIFPFTLRFREWTNYPVTLALLALNMVVFFFFFSNPTTNQEIDELFSLQNLEVAGKLFVATTHPFERPVWAQNVQLSDRGRVSLLGALALRDEAFMRKIQELPENSFLPDEFNRFKKVAAKIQKMDELSPANQYGLGSQATSPYAWITYQFSHSDFIHLLSNLLFLWLVGSLIELSFGGGILMVLYILGGICGGFLFLLIQDHGSSPVIGASGAISALIAFYAVALGMRRVSFAYFLAPFPDYYGIVYVPALVLVPVFLLADVASLIATPSGLAIGVAHAAHVGGAIFGALLGCVYYFAYRWDSSSSAGANPLRKVFSAIATGSKNCFK